jgi:hypothetical protein
METNYNLKEFETPTWLRQQNRSNSPTSSYVTVTDTRHLNRPDSPTPKSLNFERFIPKNQNSQEMIPNIEKHLKDKKSKKLTKNNAKDQSQNANPESYIKTLTNTAIYTDGINVPTPIYSKIQNKVNDPHAGIKTLIKCAIDPNQLNYKQLAKNENKPNEYQNEQRFETPNLCTKRKTTKIDIENADDDRIFLNRFEIHQPQIEDDGYTQIVVKQIIQCLFIIICFVFVMITIGIVLQVISFTV